MSESTRTILTLLTAVYEAYNQATPGGKWAPKEDGTTFCNEAISSVCKAMGYSKFDKPDTAYPYDAEMANQIHDRMADPNGDWLNVQGDVAQYHANRGALVLASRKNPMGHGHVCVVIPGEMSYSNSYAKRVPVVMNVGKDVFIGKRVSFSFKEDPLYFVLKALA